MMKEQFKEFEIPFGAKDSELCGWEYTIPEGMEATIVDNKIVVKKKESWDEKVRKWLIEMVEEVRKANPTNAEHNGMCSEAIAWLEKQGEQKPTQETESFEAEHGKYYYCIKDFFCGGRKQASKGDVVQALRGLPIMGLEDASEYFLPVNFMKCNSTWSEADENMLNNIISDIEYLKLQVYYKTLCDNEIVWLKSLKERVYTQPKQDWSEEDKGNLLDVKCIIDEIGHNQDVREKIKHSCEELDSLWHWLDNIWQRVKYPQTTWKPSDEQLYYLSWIANVKLGDGVVEQEVSKHLNELYKQLKQL